MEGLGHYSAGKAALEMLIRVAASELGPRGIRVNAVLGLTEAATTQGYIHLEELTSSFLERVPLGRLGVSGDIAPGVRYLAGPESSWMTGQSFAIDGGNEVRGAPRGPMFTVQPRTIALSGAVIGRSSDVAIPGAARRRTGWR